MARTLRLWAACGAYALCTMSALAQTTATPAAAAAPTTTAAISPTAIPCSPTQMSLIDSYAAQGQAAAQANLKNNILSPQTFNGCVGNLLNGFGNANLLSQNSPFNLGSLANINWSAVAASAGKMLQNAASNAVSGIAQQLASQLCTTIQQTANAVITQPITNLANGVTSTVTNTIGGVGSTITGAASGISSGITNSIPVVPALPTSGGIKF